MGQARPSDGLELDIEVVHLSPGRLRLRVRREALENAALQEAERALAELPAVHEVRKNPAARSVLVRYDDEAADLADLLAAVTGAGVLVAPIDGTDATRARTSLGDAIAAIGRRADQRVAELSNGAADLRTLVPIGLAALAARQIMAGQFGAVPGYVLLWYAFDAFNKLRKPGAGGDRPQD